MAATHQVQDIIISEFQKRRKKNPDFSLRAFARKLETSPAQLSQIISGKRPVTLKFLKKMAVKLNYSPRETKALLDRFSTDNGVDVDSIDLKRIHLQDDQFKLISDWYHFGILSLTRIKDAKPDPRWISSQLGISITDAAQGLTRLERMGLIQLKPQFKQIGDPIEASSSIGSEAIQKYHKQNLQLAADKLEDVPPHLRDFQSITLPIVINDLPKYRRLIDKILDLASDLSTEKNADQIYNLNIQFFPLIKTKKEIL